MKIGKYLLAAFLGMAILAVAGCGNNQSSSSTTPPAGATNAPAAPAAPK